MKLLSVLGLIALLSLGFMPGAAYAESRDDDCEQSDNCGGDFDRDGDDDRKKPKFQTRFFSE